MAKVVAVGESSNACFPFGRVQGDGMLKRKTPSELRGEQLKRKNFNLPVGAKKVSGIDSSRLLSEVPHVSKKPESLKIPKYIDTRVNDVFPVKKSSLRCKMLPVAEKAKDAIDTEKTVHADSSGVLYKPSSTCIYPERSNEQSSHDKDGSSNNLQNSASFLKVQREHSFQRVDKCSQSTFLTVAELSCGRERLCSSSTVNMDKALKGLVTRDTLPTSAFVSGPSDDSRVSSRNLHTEFQIDGGKIPLDFTLKTNMRLVLNSSIKRFHRLISNGYNDSNEINSYCSCTDQNIDLERNTGSPSDALFYKALQSWIFPQSTLPPSVISAMSLSTSAVDVNFLTKRKHDWEDSFRNLYYLLRKKLCSIFYVYTSQFVVLFVASSFSGKKTVSCCAYLSQSTHGLRSLLAEHKVCFSMPLCHSKVEQVTADDLVELSAIQKLSLGKTLHVDSSSEVDNSPQSLLAFIGNENVHALYDFLLNYRFFLNSWASFDVPVLYSMVQFRNASIFVPEVRFKEVKRANYASTDSDNDETNPSIEGAFCYSIEIKGTALPPWIISKTCSAMGFLGKTFESSFTTDSETTGLNVALKPLCSEFLASAEPNGRMYQETHCVPIPESIAVSWLQSAQLKSLKCINGSYTASVVSM